MRRYAESYFESPELLDEGPLADIRAAVAAQLICIAGSSPIPTTP